MRGKQRVERAFAFANLLKPRVTKSLVPIEFD
jgi:hypothetical protein